MQFRPPATTPLPHSETFQSSITATRFVHYFFKHRVTHLLANLGWVDLPSCSARSANFSPGRTRQRVDQPKSKSTQPRFARRCVTLNRFEKRPHLCYSMKNRRRILSTPLRTRSNITFWCKTRTTRKTRRRRRCSRRCKTRSARRRVTFCNSTLSPRPTPPPHPPPLPPPWPAFGSPRRTGIRFKRK